MAKGNDGNYLQHCVEVEAAVLLAQTEPNSRLHVALTHGMAPFERIGEPKGNAYSLLYGALCEAASEPKCSEREIVKAYRSSWESQAYRPDIKNLFDELRSGKHYPNSAELLRAVSGTTRLSGGITEWDETNRKELAAAWDDSNIKVAQHRPRSPNSWRKNLKAGRVLCCPDDLSVPWLFSMDPNTYTENGGNEDENLHSSDLCLLAPALERYVRSGQPGIASLFAYGVHKNRRPQFWTFMDKLAERLDVPTHSYWVHHQGGNRNLAGLLFSDKELALGFVPPRVKPGRGKVN